MERFWQTHESNLVQINHTLNEQNARFGYLGVSSRGTSGCPTWMALTDVTCYVEAARHKAAFVESEKSTLDETVVFRDENLCDIDLEEARHSSP